MATYTFSKFMSGCGLAEHKNARSALQIFGVIVSGCILALAIYKFLNVDLKPKVIITLSYQTIFGAVLMIAEFKLSLMLKWFRFMAPHIGLGLCYVYVAFYIWSKAQWYEFALTIAAFVAAAVNIFFGIFGSKRYTPPANEATLERDIAAKVVAGQIMKQPLNSEPDSGFNENPFNKNSGGHGAY